MGSSISAIYDDEVEWTRIRKELKLESDRWSVYSVQSDVVKKLMRLIPDTNKLSQYGTSALVAYVEDCINNSTTVNETGYFEFVEWYQVCQRYNIANCSTNSPYYQDLKLYINNNPTVGKLELRAFVAYLYNRQQLLLKHTKELDELYATFNADVSVLRRYDA